MNNQYEEETFWLQACGRIEDSHRCAQARLDHSREDMLDDLLITIFCCTLYDISDEALECLSEGGRGRGRRHGRHRFGGHGGICSANNSDAVTGGIGINGIVDGIDQRKI